MQSLIKNTHIWNNRNALAQKKKIHISDFCDFYVIKLQQIIFWMDLCISVYKYSYYVLRKQWYFGTTHHLHFKYIYVPRKPHTRKRTKKTPPLCRHMAFFCIYVMLIEILKDYFRDYVVRIEFLFLSKIFSSKSFLSGQNRIFYLFYFLYIDPFSNNLSKHCSFNY